MVLGRDQGSGIRDQKPALLIPDPRSRIPTDRVLRAFRVPHCGTRTRRRSRASFRQQPVRRLSDVHGFGNIIELDMDW